jgi:hypothetical protein
VIFADVVIFQNDELKFIFGVIDEVEIFITRS